MNKTCGCCGKVYTVLPDIAVFQKETETYFFECVCGSTLCYVPDRERTRALIKACALEAKKVISPTRIKGETN